MYYKVDIHKTVDAGEPAKYTDYAVAQTEQEARDKILTRELERVAQQLGNVTELYYEGQIIAYRTARGEEVCIRLGQAHKLGSVTV